MRDTLSRRSVLRWGCFLGGVGMSPMWLRGDQPRPAGGFIYETASFPECHASTLVETSDGVAAAWFGGTEEGHPDVGIWWSRWRPHGGWEAPVLVAEGVQSIGADGKELRFPCWNPVLVPTPSEGLFLFYKVGPSPDRWWGMVTQSMDEGDSWGPAMRLPEGILGPVRNQAAICADGTYLFPTSTEAGGPWRVYFERAKAPFGQSRRGTTWERTELLSTVDGLGGIQPTLLKHPDGSWQALCRCDSKGKRILQTFSRDDGRSWSALEPIDLPNPNSGIDAVTLQDGRFLLVYNHTLRGAIFPAGRQAIHLAISRDGKSWEACGILEQRERGEFSYPAVIQLKDGSVHITYTWLRKKIAHRILDPSQLQSYPIREGHWPQEAPDWTVP